MKMTMNIIKKSKMPSKRKINFVCAVLPLILFVFGVLSPVWTDSFVVYVFSLLPFYVYTYIVESVFVDGGSLFGTKRGLYASRMWVAGIVVTTVVSVIGAFFLGDTGAIYYGPCMILAINIPVSVVYAIACIFADSVRYARPLQNFVA